MKIGIIHPYFDVIGGAEKTTLSLIDILQKNKIETRLYCVIPPKISETDILKITKIKQRRFPFFWRYQRIIEIKELFKKISGEDLLFIMSGGLTIEKCNARIIYLYCHSTFRDEINFTKVKSNGVKSIYFKKIQTNIKKSLKIIKERNVNLISNSNYTKNEIKINLDKDSIIINPPVDIEVYKKVQSYSKGKNIVTISRFSAEKNLEYLIKIVNQTNFQLEIIGNAKYKKQIKILDNLRKIKEKNVKIHNNLSSKEILDILSKSKVYLHTAKETFGISIIEAISAGCIPIVPNNSAHKETVPFSELRFEDGNEAKKIINNAMNGNLDYLLPKLQEHVSQFSEKNFQNKILKIINS